MAALFEKLLNVIVAVIGLVIMACWLVDQPLIEKFNPNFILMVFNSALCFALAGSAMLFPDSRPLLQKRVRMATGYFLVFFCGCILLQDIAGVVLGLDEIIIKVMVKDYNPHPGRLAPPTAIGFILCGCALILLHQKNSRHVNIAVQITTLTAMAIALVGITASSVRFELLYSWYTYGRMALSTAICLLLLSVAIWMDWYRRMHVLTYQSEEKCINITGIVIIITATLSAGMSGFSILATEMNNTLEQSLRETHSNHLELVENNIEFGVSGASSITTRLLMNRYLAVINQHPDDLLARQVIKEDAENFLDYDVPGAAIYSKAGDLVAQVGTFTAIPDIRIPLNLEQASNAELLWKEGAVLRLTTNIVQKGEYLGKAIVERKLPYIKKLLYAKGYLGNTTETRICYALDKDRMQCLPSNRHKTVFPPEQRIHNRESTSMDLALRGQSGIRIAHDYRDNQVVSAYGPVGTMGIGLVVKTDAAEFYGPIREKLQYALGLILLLACIGIIVQRIQLIPLVKRLVSSEEHVKSINRFQQTLLDSANFTIIACDNKGVIQVFNKTSERTLGYTAEEVIGKQTPRIFHDPERIRQRAAQLSIELGKHVDIGFETFIAKARLTGSDENEWVYVRKDGSSYPVLLSVSCLYDAAGNIAGSLGIGMDITERKRLEKLKNEFISTVSHELRTPLTSIRGSLGLMKGGAVGEISKKAREMTEIAYKNCERLILLINDILDIEKIESGAMRFDMQDENINNLVKQAVEANASYGEKFEVGFVIDPNNPLVSAKVDANRLIQVFSNLLSNAAKFSKPGDDVHIRITRKENAIRIWVTDKGPGIPEAFRPRIFNKFAQADSSSTRNQSGTGLGLNISKQIMEQMNGSIGFSSTLGQGTTFWIELPEVKNPDSIATLMEALEYLNADEGNFVPLILHAEDDYDLCRIVAHSLRGKATMHAASTVKEASELLKSHLYSLMILDITLPDGTGLKLLDQIKAAGQPTRIIILSAEEVDAKTRDKVDAVYVKSKVSEERIVENILRLIQK